MKLVIHLYEFSYELWDGTTWNSSYHILQNGIRKSDVAFQAPSPIAKLVMLISIIIIIEWNAQ